MALKQSLRAKALCLVQSGYNHFVYMALVFCNIVFWNQTRFPGSQERLPKNVWWVHYGLSFVCKSFCRMIVVQVLLGQRAFACRLSTICVC